MADFLRKLDAGLIGILNIILIVTSLAITGLILFLVLARFVLGWSVVGVLELATLSAMWLYMCGAVVAARNHEHLVVDFLAQSLKDQRTKALHTFAVSMIMVLLSLFFLSLAKDMVAWSIKRPQTTTALSIPLIVPQSAVVLAAVLSVVYALRDAIVAAAAVFGSSERTSGKA